VNISFSRNFFAISQIKKVVDIPYMIGYNTNNIMNNAPEGGLLKKPQVNATQV